MRNEVRSWMCDRLNYRGLILNTLLRKFAFKHFRRQNWSPLSRSHPFISLMNTDTLVSHLSNVIPFVLPSLVFRVYSLIVLTDSLWQIIAVRLIEVVIVTELSANNVNRKRAILPIVRRVRAASFVLLLRLLMEFRLLLCARNHHHQHWSTMTFSSTFEQSHRARMIFSSSASCTDGNKCLR